MSKNNYNIKEIKKNASTTFKYNNIDDKKIYESLDKVKDKSQFIKNALYYYITIVESGEVIDRNLPQERKIPTSDISRIFELLIQQQGIQNKNQNNNNANNDANNAFSDNYEMKAEIKKIEVPKELLNVTEDDFNF